MKEWVMFLVGDLLSSKKFKGKISGLAAVGMSWLVTLLFAKLGIEDGALQAQIIECGTNVAIAMAGISGAYILGQGMADTGKEAAKVRKGLGDGPLGEA
jgi:hypothetical protein